MLLFLTLALLTASAAPDDAQAVAIIDAAKPKPKVPIHDPDLGTPPLGQIPPALIEAAATARNLPLAQRMKAVSDPLMGRPYFRDPLGEGSGYDPDPLARYDAFDCLTFLEEVISLALSGDPVHAADVRLGLRYGEQTPTYAHRHHFMELQWIPDAIAAGWLRDTTTSYGLTQHMQREVTDQTWAHWARRRLFPVPDEDLPIGTMRLDVLGIEAAKAAVNAIRPGSIILTVRQDRPGVPLWISHVGFTIPAERPTVRHATSLSRTRNVRDNGLAWYIDHIAGYPNWPTAGIAILEPVEAGPRLSALPQRPLEP